MKIFFEINENKYNTSFVAKISAFESNKIKITSSLGVETIEEFPSSTTRDDALTKIENEFVLKI